MLQSSVCVTAPMRAPVAGEGQEPRMPRHKRLRAAIVNATRTATSSCGLRVSAVVGRACMGQTTSWPRWRAGFPDRVSCLGRAGSGTCRCVTPAVHAHALLANDQLEKKKVNLAVPLAADGVRTVRGARYLVLNDATAGCLQPCVLDAKVGRRTWYQWAPQATIDKYRCDTIPRLPPSQMAHSRKPLSMPPPPPPHPPPSPLRLPQSQG